MNIIYRLIWSKVLNAWVAVAEGTRTRTKDTRSGATSLAAGLFQACLPQAALSLTTLSLAALPVLASAAPSGGVVVAGSASISQSGSTTTVSQASKQASLNWNSFNVGSGETVNFIQPSTSSLAINRIGGGSASQILGNVNANGQLFLVNPSGILFGRSAQVNVGGLVASTLEVADDGEAVRRKFSGNSNASVINQGNLHAAQGGYIGLLGSQVLNQGMITAQLGTVALAGGNAVTLTFAGNGLVNVQVDKNTFDTLVENRGVVIADGGLVMMSAGARDSLLNNTANNSGLIEARGVEQRNGKIVLSSGGTHGNTSVSGTLDVAADAGIGGTIAVGGAQVTLHAATLDASGQAGGGVITVGGGMHGQAVADSATADVVAIDANSLLRAVATDSGDGGQIAIWSNQATRFEGAIDGRAKGGSDHHQHTAGNGGNAEVSSAGMLDYRGSTNLLSSRGNTGNLLLDPYDLTISAAPTNNYSGSAPNGSSSNLNVNTLQTSLSTANVTVAAGAGGTAGAGTGALTVTDRVQWSANTLTLKSAGVMNINAPLVSAPTGGLILNAGGAINATAAIDVGSFSVTKGDWVQNAASLPAFTAGNFNIASTGSFLRATGGTGAAATPWLLADVYGLQGIGTSAAYLAGNYALSNNIDATTTSGWNAAAGFIPVGSSATPFTGALKGQNFSVVNLTINQPALTTGVGLFGYLSNASVANLSLLNASVTGGSNGVGALAGKATGTSALSGITVTGTVAGTNVAGVDNIGGIVGNMFDSATLVRSSSAANVSGYFYNVGGLAGGVDSNNNVLQFDSATGNVSGQTAIGGLVGHSQATVADSYATGAVTQLSGGTDAGGLIGKIEGTGSITRAYATGAVSGATAIGGLLGANYGTLTSSYWNTATSTRANAVGFNGGTVTDVNGVTTPAMHTQSTFANLDFTNNWYMTSGYNPTLRAGTTILSGSGDLTVSTGADSATVINQTSLQNLLGVGNLLVSAGHGKLTVASPITWAGSHQLGLGASGNLTVNAAANLNGSAAGSALQLFSYAGMVGINSATLSVNNGPLGIMAPKVNTDDGVIFTDATVNVGNGNALVVGTSNTGAGVTFRGSNYFNSTGSGTINFSGAGRGSGGRGLFISGATNITTTGNVSLNGTSLAYVGAAASCGGCAAIGSITNASGNLTMSATSYAAAGAGAAVDLYGATLTNAGTGNFTVNAYANETTGIYIANNALNINNTNGGAFTLTGLSQNRYGIYFTNVAINTAGNVTMTGKSQLLTSTLTSFYSFNSNVLTCSSGNLTLIGGDATTQGAGFTSSTALTLNNNGAGILSLTGISAAAAGINAAGASTFITAGTGAVNLTGTGGGSAKDISIAASGAVTFGKGSMTGTTGKGISISSSGGAISSSNNSLNTSNGALTLTASNANTDTGVTLNNDTINVGTGLSTITGNTNTASKFGVDLTGSNVLTSSGAGSVTVSGSNTAAAGVGINLGAGQTLTSQGTTALTDAVGSAATTSIRIGGIITDAAGNLTLGPASANSLILLSGSQINSTSSGNLALTTHGAGAFTNNGAIAQGSGGAGTITISTADGTLTNAGTISGGASAGAITVSSSGSGAIADGAGTINQAGNGAVSLNATGGGTVSADTISYSNAAPGTLAISGTGAVTTGNAIASTGGALGVTISGGAVTLGPSIVTNGGSIAVTGPAVLGSNATLTAGAGTIGFSSTINGNHNLSASGANINLTQAVGGTTALGAVSLQAANSLSLPSIRSASLLARTTSASGDITISSGATLAVSDSGNAATLAAGRNFINNAGASAIGMTGGGRWLIYSATPGADSFNHLDSANAAVWASTYTGTTPSLSQTGNRYVFAYQPTLTFTSNNTSKIYGSDATAAVATAYTVSGLQSGVSGAYLGDSPATVYSGTPTVSASGSAAAATVAGGPYPINVAANNVTSLDNYALAYQSTGLLTVTPAPLTVTAGGAAKTYDGLAYSGGNGLSYSGFVNGQDSSLITGTNVWAGTAQGAVNAGNYQILGSGLSAANYVLNYAPGTLTVAQAGLTIKANDASTTYHGLADTGGNGVTYSGLVNSETSAVLSGTLGYGGTAQGAKNAGSYTITAAGLTSGNYAITYQPGSLTIDPAALSITANHASKTYDGLAFMNGAGVTYSGLVNSETPSVLSGTLTYGGPAQGAVNAGSYALTASGLSSGNYTIAYIPGTLDVAKAALAVTASDASKSYDGLAFNGGNGVTYSGFVHGENDAVLTGAALYGGPAQGAVDAGNYALTASGLSSANYAISYLAGTLTVGQAGLAVTASNANKTYDGLAYAGGNGVTYAGFVHGETDAVLTGSPNFGGAAQGAVNAGSYVLTASGLSSGNYAISYLPGSLNVSPAALSVTANNAGKTYDGMAYTGGNGVSFAGFVHGENDAVLTGAAAYGGTAQGAVNAGSYALTASGLAADNYAISYVAGTLTINQAALSATPNQASKTYDGLAYTGGNGVTYAGLVHGETNAVVTGTPAYAGAAQGAIDAGAYALTVSGLSASNYAISYLPGGLNVTPAALAVTANNASKTYDGLAYAGSNGVSYAGFVHGENASVLSGTPAFDGSTPNNINVGSHAVTASGLSSNNYALNYLPGIVSVTPAALVISANDASKTYDGLGYVGGNGLSYAGLVNGETAAVLSGTAVFGGQAQGATNAGHYGLTAAGLSSGNYAISYAAGTLTVAQAPLTVAANNATKTYDGLAYSGSNNVSYSGFVHGENDTVLSGSLTFIDHAQGAVNAGNYHVMPGGLSAANYALSYLPGTLSVTPAALVITAQNASKPYDGMAYAGGAGVSYSGLVQGETEAALNGALAYGGSAQGATNAGMYGLTASGLSASNYAISYVPGTLNVSQAPLTISANNASKTYDGLVYAGSNGVTYTGLVHGETAAVLSGTPTFGGAINAGTYALTPAGYSSSNYAINYLPGTLTIEQAALLVSANNAAKTYDGLAYAGGNGVSYAGFVAGDDAADLAGRPVFGGAAQGARHAGSYALTASGLSSANYRISYQPGQLNIGQAALAVTVNHASKTYDGQAYHGDPGVSYAGLVNGETQSVLAGSPTLAGAALGAVDAGNYGLTASGLSSGNYAITYIDGGLTVNQAALTVTAANASKAYDALPYAGGNGVIYAGLVNGDSAAVITGTAVYGGTAQGAVKPGTYSLTAAGLASANYAITYLPGALQVEQPALSATALTAIGKYASLTRASGNDTSVAEGDMDKVLAVASALRCAEQGWFGATLHSSGEPGVFATDSRPCPAAPAKPAGRLGPFSSSLGSAAQSKHYRP